MVAHLIVPKDATVEGKDNPTNKELNDDGSDVIWCTPGEKESIEVEVSLFLSNKAVEEQGRRLIQQIVRENCESSRRAELVI
jgi:hypothetical protein